MVRLYLHSAVINVAASVKRDLAYVFLKTQLSYSLSHKLCCSLQRRADSTLSWSLMCPRDLTAVHVCNVLGRLNCIGLCLHARQMPQ